MSNPNNGYLPLVYSSAWPARPSSTMLSAGMARYIGPASIPPTDALVGDSWTPIPKAPRPVIWSTDWYTDVDDAVGARILAYHHLIGDVKVQAVVVDQMGSPTLNVGSLDAFLRSEGLVVPIGQTNSTYSDLSNSGSYQQNIYNNLPHAAWSSVPTAASVMRTALVGAASKVDIHCNRLHERITGAYGLAGGWDIIFDWNAINYIEGESSMGYGWRLSFRL